MSSFDRRVLRNRCIRLANTNHNRLNEIMLLLADHAFAFPSHRVETTINTNQTTSRHVELKKKLKRNKRMIFDLLKQETTLNTTMIISQLRSEATQLTHDLTAEIQTEGKSIRHNESMNDVHTKSKSQHEISTELRQYS
ncbi:unnamed protein product, partial [Rotaria sordida]